LYNKHYKDAQSCFYFRENINHNLLPKDETTNLRYSILSTINKNNYVFIVNLTDTKDAIKNRKREGMKENKKEENKGKQGTGKVMSK